MPLDAEHEALVDQTLSAPEAISAVGWMICYPNDSRLGSQLEVPVLAGETVEAATRRLRTRWNPRWLTGAGYGVKDGVGNLVPRDAPVTTAGPISWDPNPRLCRVDDQTADNANGARLARRLGGEVALTALWTARARLCGISDSRAKDLSGNQRGARFRDFLVYYLRRRLPDDWTVEPEVKLTRIRGLHMRKTVGDRSSDIVIVDPARILIAVVSSKWTWRSDRGTEAAQMVPLMRYRPDVPYALVTAEFPRVRVISTESIEDRAYHLCPTWVGAWLAVQAEEDSAAEWPDLASLEAEGIRQAELLNLHGLDSLVNDLLDAGDIL